MTALSAERRAFYRDRNLPIPQMELLPANTQELKEILRDLQPQKTPWRLIGGGHHARFAPHLTDQKYLAIRTDRLNQILHIDKKSGLVQAQAGMTWRALQEAVTERGFSLSRYGLHPATATIGGLLARYRPGPPALRGGDLLDGCIALSAFSPAIGDYRYLDAPRKSSGPDIRYHFIGAKGQNGAILTATLAIWRPVATALLVWDDRSLEQAAQIMNALHRSEITVTTVHYSLQRRRLQIILSAPGQLLRSRLRWIETTINPPDHVGDEDDARRRRRWLEARHPDRRNHRAAPQTRAFWFTPSLCAQPPTELFGNSLQELEIISWTAHRVEAFVRYPENAPRLRPQPPPNTGIWATWPLISGA